jgi:hypothetical protein
MRWRRWLIVVASVLLGCSKCGPGGSAVPFKRGAASGEADAAVAEAAPGDAQPGQAFPAQTARIELGGQPLELAQGSIRAALSREAGTGRSTALLVSEASEGGIALEQSTLEDKHWAAPERVAELVVTGAGGARCTLKAVRLFSLGASYAAVDCDFECPTDPAPAGAAGVAPAEPQPAVMPSRPAAAPDAPPAPDTPPAPAGGPAQAPPPPAPAPPAPEPEPATSPALPMHAERHFWVVGLAPAPRVIEHIATDARRGDVRIEPALQSRDLDGDGNADVLLVADIMDRDEPPTRIELKLYDRAGGLARDREEPEKTLRELADQAKTSRKASPQRAFDVAQHVLAVHGALCREAGAPLLRIAGRGLECGPSLAAGRAATIAIAMLAAQGKLQAALALYQALDTPAYRLLDNDRERARYAMHALVDDRSYTFRSGPALDLAPGPRARRGAIAFIDEDHMLLRGPTARSYDLASGAIEAVGIAADTSVVDPSGRFVVSSVVRSCQGYHLSIAGSAQLVAGVVTGPIVAEPLAVRADPPSGAHCPELNAEQKRDDGGIHVLDWSAQGVLLVREQTLLLLALDTSANASEPARVLGLGDAMPALAHSGALTANGHYLAQVTPLGIAIFDRAQAKTRVLAAPDGAGTITDIALSPSGRKIALLRGRQVLIGEPRAGAVVPAPATPTNAPAPAHAPSPVLPAPSANDAPH